MNGLVRAVLVAGMLGTLGASSARAQQAGEAPPTGMARADLAAFVDGVVEPWLERSDVAGAVVAVVADREVALLRGYGLADVAKEAPVDAERTLFRPGSISKLFVALSVMQLVEQGKLDLDADVNGYIDFELPIAAGRPVTLRQLLTHRAGFEEKVRGLFQREGPPPPLGAWLRDAIPRRDHPVEQWPSYSNYGFALAGYVVERASGRPFDAYVAEHLFGPLDMASATFSQPLPEALAPRFSSGYLLASLDAGPFEIVNPAPAGGLSASGRDMAHFLRALIGGGELDGKRVLAPETFARWLEPQVIVAGNGFGLGVYQAHPHGVRLFGHAGDTAYFHSELMASAELGFGVFVSQNSLGNGGPLLRDVLVPALAKRYFARARPAVAEVSMRAADAVGRYMTTRRSDHSLIRMSGLLAQVRVSLHAGELVTDGLRDYAGNAGRWREVAPDRFRSRDGRAEIEFQRDARGRVVRLLPPFPGVSYERIGLLDSNAFTAVIGVPSLAIAVGVLVAGLAGAPLRRALGAPVRAARPKGERIAPLVAAALWLLVVASLGVMTLQGNEVWRFSEGEDGWVQATVWSAFAAVLASLLSLFVAQRAARNAGRPLWRRAAAALPALAFLALSWLAWNWGLLSNPTRY